MAHRLVPVAPSGGTDNLERWIWEQKNPTGPSHTQRYNTTQLVYVEESPRIGDAIAREKQWKDRRRSTTIKLIGSRSPRWLDLRNGRYDG